MISELKTRSSNHRKCVLCIEDDPTQRMIVDPIMREVEPGVECRWVSDALQAFNQIRGAQAIHEGVGNPFDLVLTDIFLDGKITGIDFWRICRKAFPHMPVLIMSALPFNKLIEFDAAYPLEARYIEKPIDIPRFHAILRETFDSIKDLAS